MLDLNEVPPQHYHHHRQSIPTPQPRTRRLPYLPYSVPHITLPYLTSPYLTFTRGSPIQPSVDLTSHLSSLESRLCSSVLVRIRRVLLYTTYYLSRRTAVSILRACLVAAKRECHHPTRLTFRLFASSRLSPPPTVPLPLQRLASFSLDVRSDYSHRPWSGLVLSLVCSDQSIPLSDRSTFVAPSSFVFRPID